MPVIYVDDAIHAWRGKKWCHLFSEDVDALHVFAAKLGLKRSWFQCPPKASWPHYDITAQKRELAVRLGAVEADRYRTIEVSQILRFGSVSPKWQETLAKCRALPKE